MTDRERFLATVRDRLRGGVPDNPLRPLPETGGGVPLIDYSVDLSDPVAQFVAAATGVDATVQPLDGDAAVAGLLEHVCDQDAVGRAVVSRDPECAGVAEVLAGLGVEILPNGDPQVAAQADLGVTGAAYGIALTGSLVVDSRRAGTRAASLLPATHLALVRRETILPTAGDLFRHLDERFDGTLPSNLVLITGPSRSADIELQLTLGVHGPRRLVIGLR
jgi:L-lactate utilization protein LutC